MSDQNEFIIEEKVLTKCLEANGTITIPEGVEAIADGCFSNGGLSSRKNVQEVIMPDSVKVIGKYCFYDNRELKTVKLSNNLEKICEQAFGSCCALENINIPASVQEIQPGALPQGKVLYTETEMSLKEVNVSERNECYCSVDGILYSKDMSELVLMPQKSGLRVFQVPESVNRIHEKAFYGNEQLEEISLPETVKEIGAQAFYGCSALSKVDLSGVVRIEDQAFAFCRSLNDVKFSPDLCYIGNLAFDSCSKLSHVLLPDGLEYIGGGAFRSCNLKKVVVPKTVKMILAQAFSGCKDIVLFDSVAPVSENKEDNYYIATHLSRIGAGRRGDDKEWHDERIWWMVRDFNWINHIITVKSAETEEIKYQVRMECVPDQRQYQRVLYGWGNNAKFNFSELDSFFPKINGTNYKIGVALSRLEYRYDLPTDKETVYIKYLARVSKDVVKLCIDDGNIESLELCDRLGVLKPEHVRDCIGYANEKEKTEIAAWLIDYTNKHPAAERKKKDEFALANAPKQRQPKEPKPIDKTSDAYMKKVWGVSEQYNGKFYITSYKGADTEITFPTEVAGKKISGIASRRSAPAIYPLLTSVIIPEGYEEIGGSAFADCKALKNISIPQSVEKIGDNAFSGCASLEKIVIPEKTWLIGKWALRDCTALKDVYILNNSLRFEGKAVLRGCGNYVVHAPAGAEVGKSVKGKHFAALSPEEMKVFVQNVFSEPVKEMMLWIEAMDEESLAQIKANLGGGSEELLQSIIANHGDGYVPHVGDKVHFEGVNACIGDHGPCGEPTVHAREIELYGESLEGTVISEVRYFNNDGHTKVFDVEIRLKDKK